MFSMLSALNQIIKLKIVKLGLISSTEEQKEGASHLLFVVMAPISYFFRTKTAMPFQTTYQLSITEGYVFLQSVFSASFKEGEVNI